MVPHWAIALQFGHGTEPWRTGATLTGQAATSILQFGHGTEPWRNENPRRLAAIAEIPSIRPRHGAVEKQQLTRFAELLSAFLQFGHGTEPWRNLESKVAYKYSLSALQFGHGTEPWRNLSIRSADRVANMPSIRPRHGAVEKLEPWLAAVEEEMPSIRPRHGAVEKRTDESGR